MSLKTRILDDVKTAMRNHDRERLAVLRLVTAAIKQREVDERIELDDDDVLRVLDKMNKQRRESLEQYTNAGRDDLAAQESFELELIKTYLPEQLDDEEVAALIDSAIEATGAESIRDMGAVMGSLRSQVQGRADMKQVSAVVRSRLGA